MRQPYRLPLVENCPSCKLRRDGFFCALSAESLEVFQAFKFTAGYPAGAVLLAEGDEPRGIYMLCQGRVRFSVNSDTGRTFTLRVGQPGEILGLHACISRRPYEVTVETIEPCQVNFAPRAEFMRFLKDHGDVRLSAAQHLAQSYYHGIEIIRAMGLGHSASEKVARLLLEIAHDARPTSHGERVKLTVTHQELADSVGVSRETVTRVLGEFRKKHLATVNGATLTIQDRAALETLVTFTNTPK